MDDGDSNSVSSRARKEEEDDGVFRGGNGLPITILMLSLIKVEEVKRSEPEPK